MSGNPFADEANESANASRARNPFHDIESNDLRPGVSSTTPSVTGGKSQRRQVSITSSAAEAVAAGQPIRSTAEANDGRQSTPRSTSVPGPNRQPSGQTSIATNTNHEEPRFSLSRFNLQGLPSDGFISDVAVGGGTLLVGVSGRTCSVCRFDQHYPQGSVEVINVSMRSGDAIHRLFVDPTGNHTLISLTNGDNYYIHRSQAKARGPITKLRSVVVDSVAWNHSPRSPSANESSGAVLLGSSIGVIYEATFSASKGHTVSQVFRLRENQPICGLQMQALPGAQGGYFVMAVTGRRTRCYQFLGGPTFDRLFAKYASNPDALTFVELPGTLERSELTFFTKVMNK
jgi:hypothetical protein